MDERERMLERLVGAFLLLSLLGFFGLAGFSAIGSDAFVAHNDYRLELEHGTGLTPGTNVLIAGMRVGYVRDLQLTPERKVAVLLSVDREHGHFVREDSVGRVTMTLAGKAVIIEPGEGGELANGGALVSGHHFDLLMALERMDLVHTLEKVQGILVDLTALAEQVELGDGQLPDLVAAVLDIVRDLHDGKGALGRVLRDDALVDRLDGTLISLGEAAGEVESAATALQGTSTEISRAATSIEQGVGHIADASGSLGKTATEVGGAAGDLRSTMSKLDGALLELADTLRAIQGLPLVRAQMKKQQEDPE